MVETRLWHGSYEDGVPPEVEWPDGPLDGLLTRAAERFPDKDALIFFDRGITYRELDGFVDSLAAGLQGLGVEKGDRVSLFMPNCPQLVIAYYAVWRCGSPGVTA